jgi:hypothetical protein
VSGPTAAIYYPRTRPAVLGSGPFRRRLRRTIVHPVFVRCRAYEVQVTLDGPKGVRRALKAQESSRSIGRSARHWPNLTVDVEVNVHPRSPRRAHLDVPHSSRQRVQVEPDVADGPCPPTSTSFKATSLLGSPIRWRSARTIAVYKSPF